MDHAERAHQGRADRDENDERHKCTVVASADAVTRPFCVVERSKGKRRKDKTSVCRAQYHSILCTAVLIAPTKYVRTECMHACVRDRSKPRASKQGRQQSRVTTSYHSYTGRYVQQALTRNRGQVTRTQPGTDTASTTPGELPHSTLSKQTRTTWYLTTVKI